MEASAGSGKTKLLTDRMLRLMLGTGTTPGAPPGRVQCLTFTKAAAAEMALRLQARLGAWVTLDDAPLEAELRALGIPPGPATRTAARALFAAVLDQPGGMRIGTIHAFCQSLLRRFPLEAAISPHFQLVEEVAAAAEMQAAREGALDGADPEAVAAVAALVRADDFGALVTGMQARRDRLAPLLALPAPARARRIREAAGTTAASDADILAAAATWAGETALRAALKTAAAHGSPKVREKAETLCAWLTLPAARRVDHWGTWWDEFFTTGKPRGLAVFAAPNLDKLHPEIRAAVAAEQARLDAVEADRRALRCADATAALLQLAAPALDAYAAAKDRAGLLDYSDLIGRTERLLQDPGAAWVLYKLDGGIDHILLDEVQDTAPEQWRIAHRLTEEFFAGLGTRDEAPPRTFFAVGDPKQSIYSFQGADPDEFTRSRRTMAGRVDAAGLPWRDVALDVSFRSTTPVLSLVDAVFAAPGAGEGVADDGPLRHFANRAGDAGRAELWPLQDATAVPAPLPWTVPTENLGLATAPQRLADAIARRIADELASGTRLLSKDRPLHPGDYLVLVRSRGPFATALVRALKSCGVAVAGMDRLRLTEQVAVQDVLAAIDAVLLPEDCLSVAAVLTSPLGGLTDRSLMELCLGRDGRVWDTLARRAAERPDWAAAWAFLRTLASRADYVSPHALVAEALGPLGGRARLLARLGAEAAEPIDELLNAALAYTQLHPPSLQGFVHWIRRSGAEVKREAGSAGAAVRVMTVHGAKGLQSPVVILPDTTGLPPDRDTVHWAGTDALPVPLWAPGKEFHCPAVAAARDRAATLRRREHNRLLYVALTRAEDRLIVCGWKPRAAIRPDCWYAAVQAGFALLPHHTDADGILAIASPQDDAPPPRRRADTLLSPPLPAWAGRPGHWTAAEPPPEPASPRPMAPSRPAGAAFGPVPAATSPLDGDPASHRFARGVAAHALLQHLPTLPPAARAAAAAAHLARTVLPAEEAASLAHQVLAVLAHPGLQDLWGPHGRAEQPLGGTVDGQQVLGVVDRMAVLPGRVLLADFKTGRAAPATPEETPVRYLRQLAAYRAVLSGIFPDREVHCALVWTDGPVVVPLPAALLDRHAPGAAPPQLEAPRRAAQLTLFDV